MANLHQNRAYYAGWDAFSPDPGKCKKMECRVCGENMKVKRNVTGPTSYAAAMANNLHKHDFFFCSNAELDWHDQLRELRIAIQNSPSLFAVEQMEREIDFILKDRKPTLCKYTEAVKGRIEFRKKNPDLFGSKKTKKRKT